MVSGPYLENNDIEPSMLVLDEFKMSVRAQMLPKPHFELLVALLARFRIERGADDFMSGIINAPNLVGCRSVISGCRVSKSANILGLFLRLGEVSLEFHVFRFIGKFPKILNQGSDILHSAPSLHFER